ncbi:MAG: type II secretion system minor pseudopilin GspH [Gammaproteobacteria bacterium]|nr:type II secretion system minor pseudopilin GspH [Gammaproteobacteria bacterium]MCK5262330.1 type II secretion system minor pseudopilin GspH [Gammaproteobacteria bacterium]
MNKTKFNTRFKLPGFSRVDGFTLLELMIVIVIVAILFSFATLTIRGSSPEDLIKEEAHRLHRLIQLALEEAVLKNTEYGLEFKSNSYRFLTYTGDQWQAISSDKLLRERELPEDMEIELAIEQTDIIIGDTAETIDQDSDEEDEEKKAKPQVFLLSSEEITPEFSARFSLHGIETSYIVTGTIDGKNEVKASDF